MNNNIQSIAGRQNQKDNQNNHSNKHKQITDDLETIDEYQNNNLDNISVDIQAIQPNPAQKNINLTQEITLPEGVGERINIIA